MDTREVTHVSKNHDGTIKALCHPGEVWSPRSKEAAIRDINRHLHGYYVQQGTEKVEISVAHTSGRYLRTNPDDPLVTDNLEDLPSLFVGEFLVTSGTLIVSDPCYSYKIAHKVKAAKNGQWRAIVEMVPGGRILTATCENEKPCGGPHEFEVGVDAVKAGIFCRSVYPSAWNPNAGFEEACRDAFLKGELGSGIIMGRGVVTSTGDDGCYKAFVWRNKDGSAVAVQIELI